MELLIKNVHGISKTVFKFRYANYKKAFNNMKFQTDTKLSNEYGNIISANKTSNISWEILASQKSYNQSSKQCLLYLNKKLEIALNKDHNMVNKRFEVINKCQQQKQIHVAIYYRKD